MRQDFPHRRELKFQAKRAMLFPACLRVTLLLVCIQLALFGIRYLCGGMLGYGLVSLEQYADTASGIYFNTEGFSVLFRMDLTGMVLAIPIAYSDLIRFIIINVIFFLLLAPLRLGAMEIYWSVLRGGTPVVNQVFQWFTKGARFVKAAVVEFVLRFAVRLIAIVASIPSFYLFYLFYTSTPSMESYTSASSMLQGSATLLAVAAALFGFWVHCCLLPVRFCLASHPEYGLGEAFRKGVGSLKGYRGKFFGFRLSFFIWYFASSLSYGALDFFVLPYTSMAAMRFVQETARPTPADGPALEE